MPLLEPAKGVDISRCVEDFGLPCHIRGIEKDDHDLLRYEEIIASTKPDLLIECGTNTGVSANWFATLVPQVMTIDNEHCQLTENASPNVDRILSDSVQELTMEAVRMSQSYRKANRVMISLDSDHRSEHVLKEIYLWAPLVSVGNYLVIEDGIFHFRAHPFYRWDPFKAISDAASWLRGENFERDKDIEGRYPVTGSPAGWWKKVR